MLRRPSFRIARAVPVDAVGFTLIEVLIAIVIVSILAAIAVPQYTEFVRRSRVMEATSAMNDFRVRAEQYFQDNRTYVGACAAIPVPFDPAESNFQVACSADLATSYQVDATGNAGKGMGLFQYRLVVNAAGVTRSTVSTDGWGTKANCWVVRRGAKCS